MILLPLRPSSFESRESGQVLKGGDTSTVEHRGPQVLWEAILILLCSSTIFCTTVTIKDNENNGEKKVQNLKLTEKWMTALSQSNGSCSSRCI